MTTNKPLHPRNDSDRLYVSRKNRGRGLISIEVCPDASIQQLEDYIEMRGGKLILAASNNTDDTRISRMEITRKKKSVKKNNSMDVLRD